MTFSQLDLYFTHTYGMVNGIYLATVVFLMLFTLSYVNTGRNKSVANALLISIIMFLCFGVYSLSFQQLHGAVSSHVIPEFLMHYGKLGAPLGLIIATYLIQRYMSTQSLQAYRLLNRLRTPITLLYISYVVCFTLLMVVESTRLAHFIITLSFIPCVGVALYFYSSALKGNVRIFFTVMFLFYLANSIAFSWLIYQDKFNLSSEFFAYAHLLFNISTLAVGFAIIRFGYKSAYNYGQVRKIDSKNIINDIYPGIDKNQFYMVYQPKKHLLTENICGTEALIRWQHPEHGFIPPDEFIPIAEKTKQINTLCKWTIKQVVKQARLQYEQGYRIPISLNFSVMNFDQRVVSFLLREMKKHDLPESSIMVEITESLMLELNSRVKNAINLLHQSGINISLDDYGTGFSSLSYLRKLHVSELKIDRSFIQNITSNADNQAIVESTIQMARKMGIQVVAEGVEDAASCQLLADNNCDVIQGYYLSKPMTSEIIMPWLARQQVMRSSVQPAYKVDADRTIPIFPAV